MVRRIQMIQCRVSSCVFLWTFSPRTWFGGEGPGPIFTMGTGPLFSTRGTVTEFLVAAVGGGDLGLRAPCQDRAAHCVRNRAHAVDPATDRRLKGIAVSFVNYLDELSFFCAEVLPGLARAGLREPPGSAAARVPA